MTDRKPREKTDTNINAEAVIDEVSRPAHDVNCLSSIGWDV